MVLSMRQSGFAHAWQVWGWTRRLQLPLRTLLLMTAKAREASDVLSEGTMMERARHSDVGDGGLRDPRALAMEQLLRCRLVTQEFKDFWMRQLAVSFIQACASVPCLASAVWPLIEEFGGRSRRPGDGGLGEMCQTTMPSNRLPHD